jgi:hypothetical protein
LLLHAAVGWSCVNSMRVAGSVKGLQQQRLAWPSPAALQERLRQSCTHTDAERLLRPRRTRQGRCELLCVALASVMAKTKTA